MSGVYGLEEVLRELDMIQEDIDEAIDDIAKEVSLEIQKEAIKNLNGPNTKGTKGYRPYPVGTPTGTLARAMAVPPKRLKKGRYKLYADRNIAHYAIYVHDGTSKMEARPFLDDAKISVLDSGQYLDIATKIISNILDRR